MSTDPGKVTPRDHTLFEGVLRDLISPGFQLAFAMLHDKQAAEDAVQEAAIRAWRHFDRLDPDRPARPWFLAIVANCCRSGWRRQTRRVVPLPQTVAADFDTSAAVAQREDLRRALRRLKAADRLIVVSRYYLDLPLNEVAEIAGMSVATTKTRLYRAVKALRPSVEFEDGLR